LIVYSTYNSPRLRYIVEVLFGSAVMITDEVADYTAYDGVKINYSIAAIADTEIRIAPQGLLFEEEIKKQGITTFEWDGLVAFFATDGDIPFDVLAASFYLISRYEEYLPHEKDSYGRFAHTAALAFKHHFLQQPLVNCWMQKVEEAIQSRFTAYRLPQHSFSFLPTYDIDIAYAYKGKGMLRNTGGFLTDVLKSRWTAIAERWAVVFGNKNDPFDVYSWLNALHQRHTLQPIYFFLLAKRTGVYDKNLSPTAKPLQQLIQQCQQKYKTGIHPSWQSHDDLQLLKAECQQLATIGQQAVNSSRQHYIQFTLPYTYRCLIAAGITADYSMGYGSINGFRASYTKPFYWYDIMEEKQTALLLHPFCYMEANSFFEQGFTVEQAAEELQQYYNAVKAVNGQLISIFHNHFLTEQEQWLPWRKMYANFLTTHAG
jgi:hypothetical protein